ncbi:MAG: Trk system potassium transporter TrkA [Alphaproteobacteria bacterium]|jgi:trk system potassium uptake protein TrkA|tara:strand:+ start:33818 stop:35194 length:1377 start_codon:yes stop_codon:yes gene_type:complete
MKVIICGAGQVGFGIAERLSAQKHDVTVIDSSSDLIANISNNLDVRGIVGSGSFPDVLMQGGASEADIILAVTQADEVNMIICQVAHTLFNIPTKIARIRSSNYLQAEYSEIFSTDNIPIDVIISPEIEIGESILRNLMLPGAFEIIQFGEKLISFIGVILNNDCPVVDTPLSQLSTLFPNLNAVVVAIHRNNKIIVPHKDEQMSYGDQIYLTCETAHVERTLALLGHTELSGINLVIAGAGNIGKYVAKNLELNNKNINIKLIESNKDRAEKAAKELTSTLVINGDVLDRNIMIEAGVDNADTFIALTNEENINLLSSVMAKELGSKQTLSLLIDKNYINLQSKLEIDKFINPRETTISSILRYLRKGRIRDAHSLCGGDAEIIEAEVLETSPLLGKFIKDSELPNNVRIGAILRGGIVIKPNGSTKIELHDRVVIFCLSDVIHEVEQLFRVSLEYF